MAHRSFGQTSPLPTEDQSFELCGETFHCVPLPGAEVMAKINGTGVNLATWIDDCLVRERAVASANGVEGQEVTEATDDVRRWRALMAKPNAVRIEDLLPIVVWLIEQYGERPTVRSAR